MDINSSKNFKNFKSSKITAKEINQKKLKKYCKQKQFKKYNYSYNYNNGNI